MADTSSGGSDARQDRDPAHIGVATTNKLILDAFPIGQSSSAQIVPPKIIDNVFHPGDHGTNDGHGNSVPLQAHVKGDNVDYAKGEAMAKFVFTLLGIGILLPWNAFISAEPYFQARLCSPPSPCTFNFMLWFAFVFNLAGVFTLCLLISSRSSCSLQNPTSYYLGTECSVKDDLSSSFPPCHSATKVESWVRILIKVIMPSRWWQRQESDAYAENEKIHRQSSFDAGTNSACSPIQTLRSPDDNGLSIFEDSLLSERLLPDCITDSPSPKFQFRQVDQASNATTTGTLLHKNYSLSQNYSEEKTKIMDANYHTKMIVYPLAVYLAIFLLTAILVLIPRISSRLFFRITLLGLAACGAATSVAGAGIVSSAGTFPAKIGINWYMTGQGIGGLIIAVGNLLREANGSQATIFWKEVCVHGAPPFTFSAATSVFGKDSAGICLPYLIDLGSFAYFGSCCVILAACIVSYLCLERHPVTGYYRDRAKQREYKTEYFDEVLQSRDTVSMALMDSRDTLFDEKSVCMYQRLETEPEHNGQRGPISAEWLLHNAGRLPFLDDQDT